MTNKPTEFPKAPRWINTEAGQWAWQEYVMWRNRATGAFSVGDRTQLLNEAEQLWQTQTAATAQAPVVLAGL